MTIDEPLSPTAARHATCMADAEPGSDVVCGAATTLLLTLTCDRGHYRLVSVCDEHGLIALTLTEPGALSHCALCEELTGIASPMTLSSTDEWDPHHPGIEDAERTRQELEEL